VFKFLDILFFKMTTEDETTERVTTSPDFELFKDRNQAWSYIRPSKKIIKLSDCQYVFDQDGWVPPLEKRVVKQLKKIASLNGEDALRYIDFLKLALSSIMEVNGVYNIQEIERIMRYHTTLGEIDRCEEPERYSLSSGVILKDVFLFLFDENDPHYQFGPEKSWREFRKNFAQIKMNE